MRVRIRIAFTLLDVFNEQEAARLLSTMRERIWHGAVYDGDADDIHLVARAGGRTLAEMGKSPEEKP